VYYSTLCQVRRDRKAIAPFAQRLIAKAAFVRQVTSTKLNATAAISDDFSNAVHDQLLHRSAANSRNNSSSCLLHQSSSCADAVTAVPQLTVVPARKKVKSAVARTKLASVALAASRAAALATAAAAAAAAAASGTSNAVSAAAAATATATIASATATAAAVSSVSHVQTVQFDQGSAGAGTGSSTVTKGNFKDQALPVPVLYCPLQ
jgi:hypothetical protein